MNEKVFKSMGFSGVTGIVTGIVVLVAGVAAGVMMIISGSKLMKDRTGIMF
ncbi:MAG: hypothetical protein PHY47_02295 [Lachnospiraceae bacterium]|nr:hypothetical protein [Lachnospiraceae bacterium]